MAYSPKKNIDSSVIASALAGDQEAYTQILDRYRGPLYHMLYKMVHNKEEAEDLTQEAFMKAFRALSSFNEEYAFSTWLYKIAANNCIDYLRKKRLQTFSYNKPVPSKDGEVQREYPDEEEATDKNMLAIEKTRMINLAIEDLPAKYKQAIELRHKEEMSYEDIAEMLDIPLGTVKARIFRAREMLKRRLKGKILP
ncbi:MAG: sigma-70 family RNA polymerase sigma factor [Deferribacteres bacterium]|nr:sigma-70 family RNA polymerase sigma factor [candidate division KSB1 bacterium]MCB9500547.1 sigma-70 family RNA polymerase sigma factor [Deferribacteres bacterium]